MKFINELMIKSISKQCGSLALMSTVGNKLWPLVKGTYSEVRTVGERGHRGPAVKAG